MPNTLLYEFCKGRETCLGWWRNLSLSLSLPPPLFLLPKILRALHCQETLTLPFLLCDPSARKRLLAEYFLCASTVIIIVNSPVSVSHKYNAAFSDEELKISMIKWFVQSNRVREGMKLTQIPCLPISCSLSKHQTSKTVVDGPC